MIHTAEEFMKLLKSEDKEDYHRLRFDEATDAVWFDILKKYPEATTWVILNKTVSIHILRYLAESDNPEIRREVASKRKLDTDLFEKLANDPDEGVRAQVANNKKVPKSILDRLIDDPDSQVSEAAK